MLFLLECRRMTLAAVQMGCTCRLGRRGMGLPSCPCSGKRREVPVPFIVHVILTPAQDLLLQFKAVRIGHLPCRPLRHFISLPEYDPPL